MTLLSKTSNLTLKLTANCASRNQDTLSVLTILSIFYLICVKCHNLVYHAQLQITHFKHTLSTLILLNGPTGLAAG